MFAVQLRKGFSGRRHLVFYIFSLQYNTYCKSSLKREGLWPVDAVEYLKSRRSIANPVKLNTQCQSGFPFSPTMSIQMCPHYLFYVGISILVCPLAAESYALVDHKYGPCKPKNCGSGPNISYPFYIYDTEIDFCGHPGFGIFCEENKPLFRTSRNYFIEDISYETQSFRLVNKEVVNTSCVAP